MVARATTSTWVAKVELKTSPGDRRRLNSAVEATRLAYNAALGEALKRLRQMRRPKAWREARELPTKEKREAYREMQARAGFSHFDLAKWLTQRVYWKDQDSKTKTDVGLHINTYVMSVIAKRAQEVAERYKNSPKARPRFRRYREVNLIPSRTNGPFRYKEGCVLFKNDLCKLRMPLLLDQEDPYHQLIEPDAIKYIELKRETIRNRERWYAIIVMEGEPPTKDAHRGDLESTVGVDIGTQTVAAVGPANKEQVLEVLSPSSELLEKERRVIQRQMDRQRRANNPDAFDDRGRVVARRGYRWKQSKRYKRTRRRLSEIMRRQRERRKLEHQALANRITDLGAVVRMEKLSWKGFQQSRYGKTQGFRAPGSFAAILEYAAQRAGGQVEWIDTRKTALSQYNHVTDERHPEDARLGKRWKTIDGQRVQRDLYSAFLARHVNQNVIDRSAILREWTAACSSLQRAVDRDLTSRVRHLPSSLGVKPGGEKSAACPEDRRLRADGRDLSSPRKRSPSGSGVGKTSETLQE